MSIADEAGCAIDREAFPERELPLDLAQARAAAHVEVLRRLPTVLLQLSGLESLTLAARATAEPRTP